MPQPPVVTATADPLIASYETAWRRIVAEQDALIEDPTRLARRRRLQEVSDAISRSMDALDVDLGDWIAKDFPRVYAAGLVEGAAGAGSSPVWSAIHQEAVEELAYGIYDDLLGATRHVRDTTKSLVRTIARQEGLFALQGGRTATQASRTMRDLLAKEGISAITYKDGSRHGLGDYAEMNMRTTTALGYNRGTINGATGITYFEVFDGPGCGWSTHNSGQQALGMLVTREEALAFPISHPRCRRAFGPRPDITSPADIADRARRPDTVQAGETTFAQRVAQQEQDAARLAAQTRAAVRRRAAGRSPRVATRGPRSGTRAPRSGSAPQVPTPVRPVARGTNASSVVKNLPGPGTAVGREIRRSLAAIESVHRIPEGMPDIPVKVTRAKSGFHGAYGFYRDGRAAHIQIRSTSDSFAGTFTHEFGHFLDHQGDLAGQTARAQVGNPALKAEFGSSRWGRPDPEMKAVLDAIEASPSYRHIVAKELRDGTPVPLRHRSHTVYLAGSDEAVARSYHQWVATRSGDRTMLDEIDARRTTLDVNQISQWEDDEFGPIAEAYDALFRARGLLVEG